MTVEECPQRQSTVAVVQRWVLVKVRLWLGITVLVCPRLSDSGDVAKTMSREL